MKRFFYISFAEPGKFLGAAVVEADDQLHAVVVAHGLGINPGGQAVVVEFPTSHNEGTDALIARRDRLITADELRALDPEAVSEAEREREHNRRTMN